MQTEIGNECLFWSAVFFRQRNRICWMPWLADFCWECVLINLENQFPSTSFFCVYEEVFDLHGIEKKRRLVTWRAHCVGSISLLYGSMSVQSGLIGNFAEIFSTFSCYVYPWFDAVVSCAHISAILLQYFRITNVKTGEFSLMISYFVISAVFH